MITAISVFLMHHVEIHKDAGFYAFLAVILLTATTIIDISIACIMIKMASLFLMN